MKNKDCKDYSNKPVYDDVPIVAFSELGQVALAAKKKYGNTETWRNFCPESKIRYWNAGLRHAFAWIRGEKLTYAWLGDKTVDIDLLERGYELSHLTLAMWNFGAAREAEMWYKNIARRHTKNIKMTKGENNGFFKIR